MRSAAAALVLALAALCACGGRPAGKESLRVLHAAGLTPLLDAVRADCERDLAIVLENEPSGSQVAIRKVTELGKPCDLLMLADAELVASLLAGRASFRVDFAADAMVLAVGARAPRAEEAEKAWPSVLLRDEVRLARADEALTPTGYRTFMVWQLYEQFLGAGLQALAPPDLEARLRAKPATVVDQVTQLPPLLQAGEADYAFAYRSLCVAQGIRFVELDPRANLGDADRDYSGARVEFRVRARGGDRTEVAVGRPITWCLTVPDAAGLPEPTRRFVAWLLRERAVMLREMGLVPLSPPRLRGAPGAAGYERARAAWGDLVVPAGGLDR